MTPTIPRMLPIPQAEHTNENGKRRYLDSTCTDGDCRLCHTPKAHRRSGQYHAGLSWICAPGGGS